MSDLCMEYWVEKFSLKASVFFCSCPKFAYWNIEMVNDAPGMFSKWTEGIRLVYKKAKFVLFPELHQLGKSADVAGVEVQALQHQEATGGAGFLRVLANNHKLGWGLVWKQASTLFFNYTFISVYKIYFFIPYQRYCFGYFVCATEIHCQLWF